MAEINLDNFFKQLYAMGRITMPSPAYESHKDGCEYCGRHASINQTCDGCGAPTVVKTTNRKSQPTVLPPKRICR